jgi:hypothetical protein
MLYLIGTTRLTLDPISGGNGRPLAWRAISRAAWSRVADPELPVNRADMTWPLRPIVMASRMVPCSPRARAASDHARRKEAASAALRCRFNV